MDAGRGNGHNSNRDSDGVAWRLLVVFGRAPSERTRARNRTGGLGLGGPDSDDARMAAGVIPGAGVPESGPDSVERAGRGGRAPAAWLARSSRPRGVMVGE